MEEQLRHREEKIAGLEAELAEVRRKGQREKEMLKRATKQHRSQAAQSEHTVEALAAQIEDMVSASVEISFLNKWNVLIQNSAKYHQGREGGVD